MAEENKSQFLKDFEKCGILRPSFAYHQACSSYPYRISELVFGSLLASYILGFVSITTSQLDPAGTEWHKLIFHGLVYLSISCSFSFLTAALYTVYHNSILTMPNVPISDLTTDFLIAISQAVFFGISLICPSTFFICLGLLLLLVFVRQEMKFRALAKFFYKKLGVENDSNTPTENTGARDDSGRKTKTHRVHDLFRLKLTSVDLLEGWGPVRSKQYWGAITLIVVGLLISVAHWDVPFLSALVKPSSLWIKNHFPLVTLDYDTACGILYPIVTLLFFLSARKILEEKSVALDDSGQKIIEKMDDEASKLAKTIKTP